MAEAAQPEVRLRGLPSEIGSFAIFRRSGFRIGGETRVRVRGSPGLRPGSRKVTMPRHLSSDRILNGPLTSAWKAWLVRCALRRLAYEINVFHAQRARKLKEGHYVGFRRPCVPQTADIWLESIAARLRQTLLREALALPDSPEISADQYSAHVHTAQSCVFTYS